jgi:hemerythrin
MTLVWTKELETGFKAIDDQHKMLFKNLTEFHAASMAGLGRPQLAGMLDFIAQYVYQHFSLEESYMESHDYPHISEHKKAHEQLKNEYKKLNLVLAEDGIDVPLVIRTNIFLGSWWKEHICTIDKAMVQYVKGKRKKSRKRAT